MSYWIRWHGANGEDGGRLGPFKHRKDAVSRIEADMDRFAAELEYGTGSAGVWVWDTSRVATLWRDDLDILLGRYVMEQVASEEPDR